MSGAEKLFLVFLFLDLFAHDLTSQADHEEHRVLLDTAGETIPLGGGCDPTTKQSSSSVSSLLYIVSQLEYPEEFASEEFMTLTKNVYLIQGVPQRVCTAN